MTSIKSIESSQNPPPQSRVFAPGSVGFRFGPAIWLTMSSTRASAEVLDECRRDSMVVHDTSAGKGLKGRK
jgi:hypothetical protein